MIDVESVWTSESLVANLEALANEFYAVMCNDKVPSPEEAIKLDDKHDFAFSCKCGRKHFGRGHIWSVVATTINNATPSEDHPEREAYVNLRKQFMTEVQHFKIRDYAEPFLRASPEGFYIEAAINKQKKIIAEFQRYLCQSKITPETDTASNIVVAYFCEKHDTDHYVSPQKNNAFRSSISGSHVPQEFLPFLCKLSQRIVLRDTSAVFREWSEAHPQHKVQSFFHKKRLDAKASRKVAEMVRQAEQSSSKEEKQKAKAAAKTRILNKNASEANKALVSASTQSPLKESAFVVDNSNLYILPPHLMSEEWLIEYLVCGRKVAYEKVSEALIYKHLNFQEGYDVYECSYCDNWHYGRKGKPVSPSVQAKRGLRWYKHNHKKANIFLHRIMMEEF